jgi:hypothetical protein
LGRARTQWQYRHARTGEGEDDRPEPGTVGQSEVILAGLAFARTRRRRFPANRRERPRSSARAMALPPDTDPTTGALTVRVPNGRVPPALLGALGRAW